MSNMFKIFVCRVETVLQKKPPRTSSSSFPNIAVRLEYTLLPPIQLDQPESLFISPMALQGIFIVTTFNFLQETLMALKLTFVLLY